MRAYAYNSPSRGRNFRTSFRKLAVAWTRRLVISVVEVVEGGARAVEAPETPGRIARGIDTSVIPRIPHALVSTPLLVSHLFSFSLTYTFSILMPIRSSFHILHSCALSLSLSLVLYKYFGFFLFD